MGQGAVPAGGSSRACSPRRSQVFSLRTTGVLFVGPDPWPPVLVVGWALAQAGGGGGGLLLRQWGLGVGGWVHPAPQVVLSAHFLEAPKKIFDWPKAQKRIWPNLLTGGGSRGAPLPPPPGPPGGGELLKGAPGGGGGGQSPL